MPTRANLPDQHLTRYLELLVPSPFLGAEFVGFVVAEGCGRMIAHSPVPLPAGQPTLAGHQQADGMGAFTAGGPSTKRAAGSGGPARRRVSWCAAQDVHPSHTTKGAFDMTKGLLVGLALVALVGDPGPAQEKAKAEPAERVKVVAFFAAEHVPVGLKAGTRVDLKVVVGKTVSPRGLVAYNTTTLVADIEVASVTPVEKPDTPDKAVKVELLVPKGQAERVEKTRDHLVTVIETVSGGTPERKTKPVTLRLELPEPGKK
jgi:hypothetical protein